MARDVRFKPGDKAVIDPAIKGKPKALQKLIGHTKCDISELEYGLTVTNVIGTDIEFAHPRKPGLFTATSRHFVHAQV